MYTGCYVRVYAGCYVHTFAGCYVRILVAMYVCMQGRGALLFILGTLSLLLFDNDQFSPPAAEHREFIPVVGVANHPPCLPPSQPRVLTGAL